MRLGQLPHPLLARNSLTYAQERRRGPGQLVTPKALDQSEVLVGTRSVRRAQAQATIQVLDRGRHARREAGASPRHNSVLDRDAGDYRIASGRKTMSARLAGVRLLGRPRDQVGAGAAKCEPMK